MADSVPANKDLSSSVREMTNRQTIIDIIRHGEPVGGSCYRGHGVDDMLSDRGWRQMWAAVGDFAQWSRIITSPLRRCCDFAEALASSRGIPFAVDERMKEVGFGSWEGRSRHSVITENYQAYRRFYADPVNARPEGAEPLEGFYRRVTQALHDTFENYPEEHLLLVAHAGVIRAAVGMAMNASLQSLYAVHVEYANITRLVCSPDRVLRLIFHARTRMGCD